MANYTILSDKEIRFALVGLPDWKVNEPNIEATFTLKTFRDAIASSRLVLCRREVLGRKLWNSKERMTSPFFASLLERLDAQSPLLGTTLATRPCVQTI